MTELKPCPFCGGEARVFHFSSAIRDEVWRAVCDKLFCAQGPDGYTEAEAIAAWNTRVERTCYADEVTHRDCKYSVNRGWRERTCKEFGSVRVWQSCNVWSHELSCGHEVDTLESEPPNYCPFCGAKVIGG